MKLIFLLLLLSLTCFAFSQDSFPPKREMRGVWIATAYRIDFPKSKTTLEQQAEFNELLNEYQRNGINTVFVQIRPCSDAFYKSKYEPFSQWLCGVQGKAPEPFYDPLEFMIAATHRRNMEFHAWFNPLRACVNGEATDSTHISRTHPEWCFKYGKVTYLDAGFQEVRNYVATIVSDVVKRYDIDGVHFDDYFYPYPIKNQEVPDTNSYNLYEGDLRKEVWRRNNINALVQTVHDSIWKIKPYVKFGISPFGIWRNKRKDKLGSQSNGLSNYDALYADVRLWLAKGWIDYVIPQLYWYRGNKNADFEILARWWSENTFGKHLYIGHAVSQLDSEATDEKWRNPSEMPAQLDICRSNATILGSCFYNSSSLLKNPLNFEDSLRKKYYRYPALIPTMSWKDSIPPAKPLNFRSERKRKTYLLQWDKDTTKTLDTAVYYVVYRFLGDKAGNRENPKEILKITREMELSIPKKWAWFRKKKYAYCVSAVDRLHNESPLTEAIILKQKKDN